MKPATTISIIANDLTVIINPDSFGQIGTGKIKQSVFTFLATKKAMHSAADKTKSRNFATIINRFGDRLREPVF